MLIQKINQRLSQLKLQGLNIKLYTVHTLFTGLIMSNILYTLPAFAGQITVDDRHRIGAISRKVYDVVSHILTLTEIIATLPL